MDVGLCGLKEEIEVPVIAVCGPNSAPQELRGCFRGEQLLHGYMYKRYAAPSYLMDSQSALTQLILWRSWSNPLGVDLWLASQGQLEMKQE